MLTQMKKITYVGVTDTDILFFFFTDSILNNEKETDVMNQNYMQVLSLLICVVLI